MKKLAIVFLLVLLTPAMSYAAGMNNQSGNLYTVVNLTKFEDFGARSVNGYTVQVGLDLSKYLALEGHIGMANETSKTVTSGADFVKATVRAAYASVVARGNLRFDKTTLFGFVGMTYRTLNGDLNYSIGGTPGSEDIDESDSGATYGIGIDLYGNKTTAITLKTSKVFRATDEEDEDIDVTMLGITHYLN